MWRTNRLLSFDTARPAYKTCPTILVACVFAAAVTFLPNPCLVTRGDTQTHGRDIWNAPFEMGSGAITHILSFIKIVSGIQKLMAGGGGFSETQTTWWAHKHTFYFFFKIRKVDKTPRFEQLPGPQKPRDTISQDLSRELLQLQSGDECETSDAWRVQLLGSEDSCTYTRLFHLAPSLLAALRVRGKSSYSFRILQFNAHHKAATSRIGET
jgi:hypothetical protein